MLYNILTPFNTTLRHLYCLILYCKMNQEIFAAEVIMSISLIQACNIQPAVSTQSTTTSTRGPGSLNRNTGQDTVSLSEEAMRLSQEHSSASPSDAGQAKSKPLEHYQLPEWIMEVSTPLLLYDARNFQGYTLPPAGASEYDNAVMAALRSALDSNGIDSDNYYDDFIMNREMSMKVKDGVCALLQQDSNAMQLMKTYNPSLYQKLA